MVYFLTLDVGTTSVKTGIFDSELNPLAFAAKTYTLITPSSKIVELEPDIYWQAAKDGIREVLTASGVIAISFENGRQWPLG